MDPKGTEKEALTGAVALDVPQEPGILLPE
jgi:hypothetical protein